MSALVWRRGTLSLRLSRRGLRAAALLALVLSVLSAAALMLGDYALSWAEMVAALSGEGPGAFILSQLRAPRLATALAAGACFGLSGAIFQSLARNPLASPDVIGFTQGAGLGAVVAIFFWGASGLTVTIGATVGGLVAAALVVAVSWQGGLRLWRLILVGIGLGLTLQAAITFLMSRAELFDAAAATHWLTGSLNARLWSHAALAGGGLALLAPLALASGRALDRIEMGDDIATGLGLRIGAVRAGAALLAVLLAAIATAACGPVGFVAFVAGPLARRIGPGGPSLALAALTGAAILTAADLAGRLAFAPTELPAGIFTALAGAPYLLWLLATQIRKGAL
jgi:iron complex transport system permease protein